MFEIIMSFIIAVSALLDIVVYCKKCPLDEFFLLEELNLDNDVKIRIDIFDNQKKIMLLIKNFQPEEVMSISRRYGIILKINCITNKYSYNLFTKQIKKKRE
jgi:hypothetical protein